MNVVWQHSMLAFYYYAVAERISNPYLVRELFWQLESRIYIFRPMRMTDTILPGSSPWETQKATLTIPAFLRFLTCLQQDRPSFSSLTTESPLSIMRRAHPIYGPLVSG